MKRLILKLLFGVTLVHVAQFQTEEQAKTAQGKLPVGFEVVDANDVPSGAIIVPFKRKSTNE